MNKPEDNYHLQPGLAFTATQKINRGINKLAKYSLQ